LATILPGVACFWIFSQANLSKKIIISLLLFCGVELWFRQIMAYRGAGTNDMQVITGTLASSGNSHLGLDMMKELCWLNTFLQNGRYHANMGRGYLSEVANFVPRTFWPGKPTIGLEYAKARGFINSRSLMGVTATIATGMIGQGLENFGPYFGVVAPAFLMAVWVAILARCWCQREQLPRMLLFLVGMGLTFNLGRDVTLLVLFPFVFGYLGILCVDFLDADRARDRKKRSASTPFL
jgi:hypothetical protein